jgi:serine/threonine protein phosphatase PrpC
MHVGDSEVITQMVSYAHTTGPTLQRINSALTITDAYFSFLFVSDPHKANQDELGITLNFAGEQGDSLFAVYDGHGDEGHHCARYAKKKLPIVLAKCLRQIRCQRYMAQLKASGKAAKNGWDPAQWPLLSVDDYERCCRKALLETNKAMHDDKNVCGTKRNMLLCVRFAIIAPSLTLILLFYWMLARGQTKWNNCSSRVLSWRSHDCM